MRTENEIEQLLKYARLRTTPAQDDRILTDIFAVLDEFAAVRAASAPTRLKEILRMIFHSRWIKCAAVLVVVFAVVVSLILLGGKGGDISPGPGPGGRVLPGKSTARAARARTMDAYETVAKSPLIYKVHLIQKVAPPEESPFPALEAEVLRVFKGDDRAVGQPVVIIWNQEYDRGRPQRTCLSLDHLHIIDLTKVEVVCLVALAPADPPTDEKGRARLRNPFSLGIRGTRVSKRDIDAKRWTAAEDTVERLRLELLNALDDPDADVRNSAIRALRGWHGTPAEPSGLLWKDRETARKILAAGKDPDWRVRWVAAWMIPPEAGKEGEELLLRLLFDPVRLVRQPARFLLSKRGREDIVKPLDEVIDYQLDESLSPFLDFSKQFTVETQIRWLREHEQWEIRSDAACWLGEYGHKEATEPLIQAMNDEHFEVRRWAARSLGLIGGEGAIAALMAVKDSDDGRVRVMAAWALANLGDSRGFNKLVALLKDKDTRAAVEAAEMLGQLGEERAALPLLEATQDSRAVVRGFAAIALIPFSRGQYAEAIESATQKLENDESPYVRAAAVAAKERISQVRIPGNG